MGEQSREPYFLIEGRGLVRLIALIVAVFAAIPVVRKVSYIFNYGFPGVFDGRWEEVVSIILMLLIMMVAGSVALKGKFSIP